MAGQPAGGKSRPRKPEPMHIPIALGASATLYAISLAAVATLQSQTDRALASDRQPLADAAATVTARSTALDADLRSMVAVLNAASDAYGSAADESRALTAMVASLSREVARVSGAAAAIRPPSTGLPSAPRAMTAVGAPPVMTTTGASGKP